MHTLEPVTTPTEGKELYHVVFYSGDTRRHIMSNLNFTEAVSWINYLNGGMGCEIGKPEIANVDY